MLFKLYIPANYKHNLGMAGSLPKELMNGNDELQQRVKKASSLPWQLRLTVRSVWATVVSAFCVMAQLS